MKEILDETATGKTVIEGGAQWGKTDSIAFSRALHHLDTHRSDLLYLFPTQAVASEFSAGRFDPLLDRNQHLRALFTEVDNVHHKRAGQANFYIRGSNSEAQLISIPVCGLIVDEFDRMNLDNLGLARDRMMGQKLSFELNISTPTFPGFGIDAEYSRSDQRVYRCECPNCKEWLPLGMKNLSFKTSEPDLATWCCSACGMPWSEDLKDSIVSGGRWVKQNPNSKTKGFKVPTLISPIQTASYYARRWVEAQTSESQTQIFYNSILGEPYSVEGTRFDDELILQAQNAFAPYRMASSSAGSAMGVDVGGVQHYWIEEKSESNKRKVIRVGTVPLIDDLHAIIRQYNVRSLVIDGAPERQKARELCAQLNRSNWGMAFMAFYPNMKGQMRWDEKQWHVDLARTDSIDSLRGSMKSGLLGLPIDIPDELRAHFRNSVRINDLDERSGNMSGRWKESGPDHFVHAGVYCGAASSRLTIGAAALGIWAV